MCLWMVYCQYVIILSLALVIIPGPPGMRHPESWCTARCCWVGPKVAKRIDASNCRVFICFLMVFRWWLMVFRWWLMFFLGCFWVVLIWIYMKENGEKWGVPMSDFVWESPNFIPWWIILFSSAELNNPIPLILNTPVQRNHGGCREFSPSIGTK